MNRKEMMMRKSLVLILVLGMATAAGAVQIAVNDQVGPEANVAPGEVATITVIGEDTSNWLGYLIVDDGGLGALSNAAFTELAGDPALAGVLAYTEAGWGAGFELSVAGTASFPVGVGTLFSMDYSYEGDVIGNPTTLSLFVDPEYGIPVASVSIIPEPMTVVWWVVPASSQISR
jgi:hypothetical protein